MSAETERAFHIARAAHCRKMAAEATDPAVQRLHEQLAECHDEEARKHLLELSANENDS